MYVCALLVTWGYNFIRFHTPLVTPIFLLLIDINIDVNCRNYVKPWRYHTWNTHKECQKISWNHLIQSIYICVQLPSYGELSSTIRWDKSSMYSENIFFPHKDLCERMRYQVVARSLGRNNTIIVGLFSSQHNMRIDREIETTMAFGW